MVVGKRIACKPLGEAVGRDIAHREVGRVELGDVDRTEHGVDRAGERHGLIARVLDLDGEGDVPAGLRHARRVRRLGDGDLRRCVVEGDGRVIVVAGGRAVVVDPGARHRVGVRDEAVTCERHREVAGVGVADQDRLRQRDVGDRKRGQIAEHVVDKAREADVLRTGVVDGDGEGDVVAAFGHVRRVRGLGDLDHGRHVVEGDGRVIRVGVGVAIIVGDRHRRRVGVLRQRIGRQGGNVVEAPRPGDRDGDRQGLALADPGGLGLVLEFAEHVVTQARERERLGSDVGDREREGHVVAGLRHVRRAGGLGEVHDRRVVVDVAEVDPWHLHAHVGGNHMVPLHGRIGVGLDPVRLPRLVDVDVRKRLGRQIEVQAVHACLVGGS